MTAQTISFRCELTCKGHSTEKAQDLVTQQNDLCCFIGLTFTLYLKLSFLQLWNYGCKSCKLDVWSLKHIQELLVALHTRSLSTTSLASSVPYHLLKHPRGPTADPVKPENGHETAV